MTGKTTNWSKKCLSIWTKS